MAMKMIRTALLALVGTVSGIALVEANTVSREDCMQICLDRIQQCWGEQEQAQQMCEEDFCGGPISGESRDCLRDTLCDTIAGSITHKISICGIPKKRHQ
jgi:hypothetical protein